ncbi:hypothetical protein ACVRYA_08585 [Streptococcus respiraculi]
MLYTLWQFVAFLLGIILAVLLLGVTAVVIIAVVKAVCKVMRGERS